MSTTLATTATRPASRWPALREELRLFEGPADAEGHPSWTVHDPVRHRFVRIDWLTWEVLRHWWLGDPAAIAEHIAQHTTLAVTPQEVVEVLALARREELVQPQAVPETALDSQATAFSRALTWLLHHYLFFRIPLFKPDRWLAALLPWLRGLGTKRFAWMTGAALLGGLYGVLQQTEQLQSQWLDLMSWRGALLYGLTLCGVKVAHELGHALVAKHQGCRVPTMGVAFMVMWPVAYTDTTEAWRLPDRLGRIRIAAAGVLTELAIACWATLAWAMLPDGPLRTAAFVLATMTWVTSVLVNLSPFMRFDGYFLLCDALDMPNLHERSFMQARVWLRATLLGWRLQATEQFEPTKRRALIAFAFTTWVWRLSLYLGIAWTVYSIGFKVLGLFLLMVELGWFISAPVWRELKAWHEGWPQWRDQRRARWSAGVASVLLLLSFVPWHASATGAALVGPENVLALRLPSAAVIQTLDISPGRAVRQGQVLLEATAPDLIRQSEVARAQLARVQQDLVTASMGGEQQAQWASLQAELAAAKEQLQTVEDAVTRLKPTAPFDGVIVDVMPGLRAGEMSPPAQQVLMHLASPGRWTATAYVDESLARSLKVGQQARIGLDSAPLQQWGARVQSVSAQPSSVVAESLLVRAHGGMIDAREASGGWVPAQSLYRVVLSLDEAPSFAPRSWRGHVVIEEAAESLALRAWRRLSAAWVREAGF